MPQMLNMTSDSNMESGSGKGGIIVKFRYSLSRAVYVVTGKLMLDVFDVIVYAVYQRM